MLKRVATFAVLLLFSGIGAWAGTYYVSTSGNDANVGSQASPWRTQQHALNVMQPGDTTLVQPGIYTNAYLFKTMAGGSANLPITLRANGPVTNSITGFEIDNPWFILDGFVWDGISQGRNNVAIYFTTNGSYSQVINNTIQHSAPGISGIGWLYMDPDANGIRHAGGSCNCLVSNNTLVDLKGAQVFLAKGTNNLIIKNLVRDIQTCDLCYADGADITYRQNVFTNVYDVEGMGVHPDCMQTHADLFWEESYNVVIERNTFVDCNIALSQLTADLVGWANISNATMGAYTVNAQIPGESVAEPLSDPVFVKVSTSSGGLIATNGNVVTIKGTPVSGSSLVVSNSSCVGTTGWMELDGGTISTNIVGVNNSNWHIRNNRFIRCGNGGTGLGVASIDLPQCYWYNNVFYQCCTNVGGILNFAFYSTNLMSRGISTNGGAWNNAFISCGNAHNDGWWNLIDASSGQGVSPNSWGMFCDYNLVVDWTGSAWVAKAGFTEAHGLNLGSDPLVANYRPMFGSPLIGRGTNYMGLSSNDYEGWPRPASGTCDIGAFQFDTNLVVYLDFEEDLSQNKIQDVSGYSHDAINFNPSNWITAAPGVFWEAGQWTVVGVMTNDPGQTYNLSQYAGITNLAGIDFITNGTISVWVQWATNAERWDTILDAGYQRAYSAQPSLATNSWALHYGSANLSDTPVGPIFKLYSDDLNNPYTLISWTQPRDGSNWWHIAVTWTGTNNTVVGYQNGQAIQTNTLGGAQYLRVSGSPTPPWISVGAMQHDGTPEWGDNKYPNSGFFKGKMDDLRIYNRPLSAAEVQNLYAGASVPMQGAAPPGDPPPGDSPVITAQPQSTNVAAGGSVTFTVAATGTSPLLYQWLLNGEGIAGATASTYVDNDAQPDDAGLYSVVISNPAGSITSSSATLSVITPPVISAQPQSLVVNAGASAAFSVRRQRRSAAGLSVAFQRRHHPGRHGQRLHQEQRATGRRR